MIAESVFDMLTGGNVLPGFTHSVKAWFDRVFGRDDYGLFFLLLRTINAAHSQGNKEKIKTLGIIAAKIRSGWAPCPEPPKPHQIITMHAQIVGISRTGSISR